MDTQEYTMRELTDIELHEVAGGNPFGATAVIGATVVNSGSFAIGAVLGDNSALAAVTVTGQANVFGTNRA